MGLSLRCRPRDLIVATAAMIIGMSGLGGSASASAPTPSASSGSVTITDDSHVLSQADLDELRSDGSDIVPGFERVAPPDPVWIYTATKPKDGAAFDQYYTDLRSSAPPNVIIIAVNTKARHIVITSGSASGLSNSGADQARQGFTDDFGINSNYGSALDSTLRDLSAVVMAGPSATFPAIGQAHHHSNGKVLIFIVVLGVIIIVVIAAAAKSGTSGGYPRSGRHYSYTNYSAFQDTSSGSSDSGSFSGGDSGGGGDTSGGGTSSGNF